jgi:hypothetical protein
MKKPALVEYSQPLRGWGTQWFLIRAPLVGVMKTAQ